MSRLDALKKQKSQNESKKENEVNDYSDVLDSLMNRPNESKLKNTQKDIVDIEIDLIDTDDINEQLFGYEDLDKIETSFDTIGNNSVIHVYRRDNGRYLCFAGNQRLIASKNRGDKLITCVIAGEEPSETERVENLIFMNSQRTPRPYYIAKQLDAYEKLLRRKGKTNISEAIEEKFGYKGAMQRRYKQILKLDKTLQELFKKEDMPFSYLLDKCTKIPEGKEQDFVSILREQTSDTGISTQLIDEAYSTVTKKEVLHKEKCFQKTSQVFKEIGALPYYGTNDILIPEKKKESILAQANEMKDYLDRIIAACNNC